MDCINTIGIESLFSNGLKLNKVGNPELGKEVAYNRHGTAGSDILNDGYLTFYNIFCAVEFTYVGGSLCVEHLP